MNQRQANPGHVLVIPKSHVPSIDRCDVGMTGELFECVAHVGRAIQHRLRPDGLSFWQSNSVTPGQEIFHLHVHVLPCWIGAGYLEIYREPPPVRSRDELDAIASELCLEIQEIG
jgi:histidine triad (HIT) family protein